MKRLTERHDHGIKMAAGYDFGIDPDDYDLVQKILAKLAVYEDMEEQGRLVVLPCKIGGTMWANTAVYGDRYRKANKPYPVEVVHFGTGEGGCAFFNVKYSNGRVFPFNTTEVGRNIFITRAEAERALVGGTDK